MKILQNIQDKHVFNFILIVAILTNLVFIYLYFFQKPKSEKEFFQTEQHEKKIQSAKHRADSLQRVSLNYLEVIDSLKSKLDTITIIQELQKIQNEKQFYKNNIAAIDSVELDSLSAIWSGYLNNNNLQ